MYRGCCGCWVGGATVWVSVCVTGGGVDTSVVTTVVV
jgi:hypothetical protein